MQFGSIVLYYKYNILGI